MKPKDVFISILISIAAYVLISIALRYAGISFGILMIFGGVLLFIYRQPFGAYSWHSDYLGDHNHKVHKPTPGCLLIPFAIAIIALGAILIIKVR